MANEGILPQGERLRSAVLWLNQAEGYTLEAVEEASRRYDLSPEEQQYLIETFLPAAGADD